MDLPSWSATRWLALVGMCFFLSAYIGLSVFFRLADDSYDSFDKVRDSLSLMLGGAVAASWLLLLATTFLPQLRPVAAGFLILSLLAAMFVPPALLLF